MQSDPLRDVGEDAILSLLLSNEGLLETFSTDQILLPAPYWLNAAIIRALNKEENVLLLPISPIWKQITTWKFSFTFVKR